MGRKKIELKRLECPKERSSKYSKRKKGILKKADELALLCGIDIVMIIVSPTDKPTLFHTRSRSLSSILDRFLKISLQEREERRAYTIKTLKKLVNKNNTEVSTKNDHLSPERDEVIQVTKPREVNTEVSTENDHLSPERDEVIQDENKVTKLREVKELIAEKNLILSHWENPYEVNDLNGLNIMENYIVSSLSHIRNIKKIKIQEEQQTLIQNGKPICT